MEYERRFHSSHFEIRSPQSADSIGTIVGSAIVFNAESEDLGGFTETIDPGAVEKSLREHPDVRSFWNHNSENLLGRSTIPGRDPTLRLFLTPTELRYELDLPDTSIGRDVLVLAKRGDLRENSFGFDCEDDKWERSEGGKRARRVMQLRLHEVSPVSIPAYPQTALAVRSMQRWEESLRKRHHITLMPRR